MVILGRGAVSYERGTPLSGVQRYLDHKKRFEERRCIARAWSLRPEVKFLICAVNCLIHVVDCLTYAIDCLTDAVDCLIYTVGCLYIQLTVLHMQLTV